MRFSTPVMTISIDLWRDVPAREELLRRAECQFEQDIETAYPGQSHRGHTRQICFNRLTETGTLPCVAETADLVLIRWSTDIVEERGT